MSEKQQLQHEPPPQQQVPFTAQTISQAQPIAQQGPVWPSAQQGPAWPSTQQGPSWPSTQQQPVVVQVISGNQPVIIYDKYNSKRSRILGITQVVLAGAAMLFNVIGIILNGNRVNEDYGGIDLDFYYNTYYWYDNIAYYIGTGFWCTMLCFLSGSFAICAARTKTKCIVITHMVFAILGSAFAFIMLSHACWAVGEDAYRLEHGFEVSVYGSDSFKTVLYASKSAAKAKGMMVLSTLFLLASIGEFIACVWSCTLCCKVLCCSTTVNYAAPSIQYAAHPSGQGQIVLMSGQGQTIHGGGMIQSTGPGYLAPTGVAQAPAYAPIGPGPTQAPETGYTGQPFQYQGAVGQQTYPIQQVGPPLQPEPGTPPPAYQ